MEVKLEFDHIQGTVIQTSGRAFIRILATLSELHVLYVRPRCDVEDLVRTHAETRTYVCGNCVRERTFPRRKRAHIAMRANYEADR